MGQERERGRLVSPKLGEGGGGERGTREGAHGVTRLAPSAF